MIEEIINYRKKHGLGQSEMAALLGISREMLNKMENNKYPISNNTILKFKNLISEKKSQNSISESTEKYVTIRKEKGTEIIDNIQFKALIKINRLAIAKLMAKVYNRDVADCLEELENDTKLAIIELVGKHE